LIRREEEVVELDVPVNDALGMGRGEHIEQLVDESEQLFTRQAVQPAGTLGEVLALEQLHDQERAAVLGDVAVADFDDAGMLEAVDRLGLELEPGAELLRAGDLGVEDLDRLAPPDLVLGNVNGSHPADAHEPLERPLALQDLPDA
jgi:hypothetical protein